MEEGCRRKTMGEESTDFLPDKAAAGEQDQDGKEG